MQGEKEFKLESMRRPFRNSYTECTHSHTNFFVWGCAGCILRNVCLVCGFRCHRGPKRVYTNKSRSGSPLHGQLCRRSVLPLLAPPESQAIRDGAQINCGLSIIRLLREAFPSPGIIPWYFLYGHDLRQD